MATVFIGIGSNIGKRKENIDKALKLISEQIKINKVSTLYKNPPKEGVKGGYFINCVLKGKTEYSPEKLFLSLQNIEKNLGRKNYHKQGEARIIDLDILFYDDKIINKENICIPHPRLHHRDFVLKGLFEIAPLKKHPVLKESIKQLWRILNADNIKDSGNTKYNKPGKKTK
jgi:2-amino-4-hydroxy-6-hydroxymethyldihydropteridine diphosphokinase